MGMTDSLRLFGADRERLLCAAGHLARTELQTKSLACEHDFYFVFESRLYVRKHDADGEELVPRLEGDTLLVAHHEPATRVDFSGSVEVHAHCLECDPVVFESDSWQDTDHRRVWCEWDLVFDHGRLGRVDPVHLETRESLRQQMLRDGVGVLPDDDRVAKKHMAQLREGRQRGLCRG